MKPFIQAVPKRFGDVFGGLLGGQGAAAPEAPASPTGLAVTGAANGFSPTVQPVLTWDSVDAASSYDVRIATDAGLTAFAILTDAAGLPGETYTPAATDLNFFREYWVQVRADSGGVKSEWSSAVAVMTPLPSALTEWWFAGARSDLLNGGLTEDSGASDVCEDTDPVYNWANMGGGIVPTQAVQATRPIFHSSGMGTPSRPYAEFTGTQYLEDADSGAGIVNEADFTLVFVFQTAATGATVRHALSFIDPAAANRYWRLSINVSLENRTSFTRLIGANSISVSKDTTVNDGAPHCVIVERTGGTTTIYVDGSAGGSSAVSPTEITASKMAIGAWFQPTSGWQSPFIGGQGLIALSASAVRATSYNGETLLQMMQRFYGTP